MFKLKMCCPNCNVNLSVSMLQKDRNLKCPFCEKPFLFNDQIIEALLPQDLRKLKTEWLVKRLLPEIVKSSRFKPELLQDLQTAAGSNALLGLPYPLLTKKENGIVLNGEIRYWKSPLLYVGRNYYYLCNTWSKFSRGVLIAWATEMDVLLLKRPRVYKGGVDETKPESYISRLGRIQYSQDLCATQFCAHTALRTFLKTSPGATRNEIDKVLMFHGHSEYDIRQAFSNAKDLFVVSGKYYFREPAPKKHHNRWYGVLNVKTSRAVADFVKYYEGLSEEKIISALSEYGHKTDLIKSVLTQLTQSKKIVEKNGCYYKPQIQEIKKQEPKKVFKANTDLSQTLKNKATEVKGEYYQYSMNKPEVEVVTGKTPVSFFYKNREVSLEGRWRNLLHRVCDVLSEIDVEKLRETAKQFSASYFGLSNAGMKDPYLHRSGIWINRNISAHGSIVYTRKFIEEFGANLDDFGIVFKNESIDVVEDEEETSNSQDAQQDIACNIEWTDELLEKESPAVYNSLLTVLKVYAGVTGLSFDDIKNHFSSSNWDALKIILNNVSWAKKNLNGLYVFVEENIFDKDKKVEESSISLDNNHDKLIKVLMSRYRGGMTFDSIDFENFRSAYECLYGENLKFSDEELETSLRECALIFEDRAFAPESIIDNATKEIIFRYIETTFSSGKKILYYKSIYEDLSDDLCCCFALRDYKMLKAYIMFMTNKGEYFFFENFMSQTEEVYVNPSREVVNHMLEVRKPLFYEELYDNLSHLDDTVIRGVISANPNIIANEKECYFHIDIFEMSEQEKEQLIALLTQEIEANEYVIWPKFIEVIGTQIPTLIENNPYLSVIGIRNAVKYHLSSDFNFANNVISKQYYSINISSLFRRFAYSHETFTVEELESFSEQIESTVYLDAVFEVSARVSETLYVKKDLLSLDINAIDQAIERYWSGDYIGLQEVDSFLLFPTVGYAWNSYLLEYFLLNYSEKFCLLQVGATLHNVAGVIVKRDSEIDFDEVLARALARKEIGINKSQALNYFVREGFLTRRRYKHIDKVLTRAQQIRNLKG